MRIRKKELSVGIIGKIVNSFTNSTQDTYSADYLNKKIEVVNVTTAGTNADDYTETGVYFFRERDVIASNLPKSVNGWLTVLKGNSSDIVKQIWYRLGSEPNHFQTFSRTKLVDRWSEWNRIDGSQDYSTDETLIGTWQGKPLYRKTVAIAVSADINGEFNTNTADVEEAWINEGKSFITASNETLPINWYYADTDYCRTWLRKSSSDLTVRIKSPSALVDRTMMLTIEYTKTTD